MTKTRLILLVAAATATLTAVGVVTSLPLGRNAPSDERPDVTLDRLLMTAPASPGDPAPWTIERTWSYPDESAPNLVRRWSANGRAPELTQTVYGRRDAAAAEKYWGGYDPAENIARQFDRNPSDAATPPRLSASRARLSCAAADRDGCKIWVYWARYGQYDVELVYWNIDTAVPRSLFEAHVRALDLHVARS